MNPPWRVLANAGQETRWWLFYEEMPQYFVEQSTYEDLQAREKRGTLDGSGLAKPSDLTIINHPRNDPEAMEIIRSSK